MTPETSGGEAKVLRVQKTMPGPLKGKMEKVTFIEQLQCLCSH